MKKASLLKVAALLLAMVMMLTFATGCGGGAVTSDPVSTPAADDDDGFVMKGEMDAGSDVLQNNDSTVSTAPNGGSNNSGSNNSGSNSSGSSLITDNVDVFKHIPTSLKGKTVLFSDWGEAVADVYQKVVKKFEEDTGIKVKMVQFLNTEYITKVSQQIAAGKSPDIAGSNAWFPSSLEMLQPLPEIFDVNDGFWDKRITEALSVNGQYFYVNTYNSPFTSGPAIFYNIKLFENAGLKTPQEYYDEGNWSYETLKKVAKDCVEAGYKGAIMEPMHIAEQMNSTLIKYNPAKGTFSGSVNEDGFVSALKYVASGLEEGLFYNDRTDAFGRGGIGMTMMGTFGMLAVGAFTKMLPSEIGVVPLPSSFEGKQLNHAPCAMRGYGICRGAKNIEGAYYLLRYFLDLDKYEPAGANIFANKKLEKYYREVHLVNYKKNNLCIEYYANPLEAVGARWDSPQGRWSGAKLASSHQVSVELKKMANVLETAVNWANQKIKDCEKQLKG